MADPWAEFVTPAAPAAKADPWAEFAPAATAPAKPEPRSGAADVGAGIVGGAARGALAVPGIFGDVAQGADWLVRKSTQYVDPVIEKVFGIQPGYMAEKRAASQPRFQPPLPPGTSDLVGAVEKVVPLPKAESTPGKYAETAAGFAPGAAAFGGLRSGRDALMNVIFPGLASEAAGQATAGTAAEPFARFGAAIAAPVVASRIAAPVRGDPARQPLVDTLAREGVDVSAGQASGSKALRYAESALSDLPLGGGGAAALAERQGQQFNRAAARRMGENADMLTPEVMGNTANRLGQQFDDISARNTLRADPQLGNDIGRTLREYDLVLPSDQRQIVGNLATDIVQRFTAGGGALPGAEYQTIRSRLTRAAHGSRQTDPEFSNALRGLRNALDDGMGRSIQPADAGLWEQTRREYANMKTIEQAMGGAGENTAAGYLSPQQLRASVAQRDRTGYVRGEGDFGELARAGAGVLQPMPQSGTAPRNAIIGMSSGLGGLAYGTGSPSTAGAALAAAFLPAAAGRTLMSGPVQAWLSNRPVPQSPDPLIRAIMGTSAGMAP